MSTRSTICVKDAYDKFCIYRHCDGYPHGEHGVVAQLAKALPFAWELPRFEAMDFAAAIIRAWKDEGGGNIYFTQGHEHHGDTEYTYDITAESGEIFVAVNSTRTGRLFTGSLSDATEHFAEEPAY